MNDLEKQFEYANEKVKLSASEKAFHRAELLSLMREHPKAVPSPYVRFLVPAVRYAFVVVLMLSLGGGGIVLAAEDSLPGETLYGIKLNVSEPVLLALTDEEERADFQTRLVDRRLSEIARASREDGDENLAPASESLAKNIEAVQAAVARYQDKKDALRTAAQLESVLTAHGKVLDEVSATSPEIADDIDPIEKVLEDEAAESSVLTDAAEDAIEQSADSDFSADLAQIREEIADELANLPGTGAEDAFAAVEDIARVIAEADEERAAGDASAALLLYTDAHQLATELRIALEADEDLGATE